MNKKISIIMIFVMLFFVVSPVHANNSHNNESLFNFNSQISIQKDNIDNKSEDFKNNTPISNLIDIKNKEVLKVIIKTKKPLSEKEAKTILGNLGNYNKLLNSVTGFSAYVPKDNIDILLRNDIVEQIYKDAIVKGLDNYTSNPTEVSSAPLVWEELNIKGDGVGVAVLDTGVYPHNDLIKNRNRIVAFKDFVNNRTESYDDNGHGTHIAGIIASNGYMSNGKYVGIAPNTNIISVKVLDSNEQGYISNVIQGIDWVIENKEKYNIKVINLSLGTDYTTKNDPLIQAVEKAWNKGIVVVTAAGNNGPNGKVMSPAVSPLVVTVGSSDSNGTIKPYDDTPSWFSVLPQETNGVIKPEIYSSGNNIVSLLSLGGIRAKKDRSSIIDSWYYKMSGTSMSAPSVSGSITLLLSQNPDLNPNQVKEKLISSSINVNGINILNVSKMFGLEPIWNEDNEIINNTNSTNNSPNYDINQVNPPINETTEDINEDTTNKIIKKEITKTNNSELGSNNELDIIIDSINNSNKSTNTTNNKEEPTISKEIEVLDNSTSLSVTNENNKETAEIPKVDKNALGVPFVEQTYENKNVLEFLIENQSKYNNTTEIQLQYENITDIVKLFNIINRSFTREDFLYFQYRLNN